MQGSRTDGPVHDSSGGGPSFSRKVLIALLMIAALLAVWKAREVLLVAMLGVLFGVGLTPVLDWLERHRIRRVLGILLVLLVTAGLIAVTVLAIGPSLKRQAGELRKDLPAAMDRIWSGVRDAVPAADLPSRDEAQEQIGESSAGALGTIASQMVGVFRGVVGAVGGLLLVIAIACYTALNPRVYTRSFLMLLSARRRKKASEAIDAIAVTWRRWLFGQLISMVVIGVLTTGALLIIGVRAPLALGLLAGISEFIPVFGPLLSAIPALAIAFLESPTQAMWVLVAYLVIQQIESNVVTPLVMKEAVHVPPLITILAGSLMVLFAGFAGLLMAVPLAAAVLAAARVFVGEEFLA